MEDDKCKLEAVDSLRAAQEAGRIAIEQQVVSGIEQVLKKREATFVIQAAQIIASELSVADPSRNDDALVATKWQPIESLSRLRAIVGGRFENIKKKWTEAGLPLREHRGDKDKTFAIDSAGWEELSAWLLKHGYESRITPQSELGAFEVRPIPGSRKAE
jgi:hypothetical protein